MQTSSILVYSSEKQPNHSQSVAENNPPGAAADARALQLLRAGARRPRSEASPKERRRSSSAESQGWEEGPRMVHYNEEA